MQNSFLVTHKTAIDVSNKKAAEPIGLTALDKYER